MFPSSSNERTTCASKSEPISCRSVVGRARFADGAAPPTRPWGDDAFPFPGDVLTEIGAQALAPRAWPRRHGAFMERCESGLLADQFNDGVAADHVLVGVDGPEFAGEHRSA